MPKVELKLAQAIIFPFSFNAADQKKKQKYPEDRSILCMRTVVEVSL